MEEIFIKNRYVNTKNGYIKLYLSNGKVVEEHRYLIEKHLGRKLSYNEIVHHKDGNKHNNILANLEVQIRSFHARDHATTGKTFVTLTCSFCNRRFERLKNQVTCKIKKGQKDFYCNRTCMSSHFGNGRIKK